MNFTPEHQAVLLARTNKWQTPMQVAGRLPIAQGNPINVNELITELMCEGLVQANPVVLGLYRLTVDGMTRKALELGENQ